MSTVVTKHVGDLDLTGFCSCPDPCASCCGHTCGACTGIPDTLHATVTAHGTDCGCLAGQVWTLTYDSGSGTWKGSKEIDGLCLDALATTFLTLTLSCVAGSFSLAISDTTGGTHTCLGSSPSPVTTTPTSTTCSPLSVVFASVSINDCCDGNHGPTVVFTVTP